MIEVEDDHLGGAARGAARFDGAGGAVADLEEAHQAAIVAAVVPSGDEETLILAAQYLSRLSPSTMFGEAMLAILNPSTRTLGPIYLSQLQGAVIGAPLPLGDSLIIAWPQIVGLVAGTILLFVGGYVVFQRQEVRA